MYSKLQWENKEIEAAKVNQILIHPIHALGKNTFALQEPSCQVSPLLQAFAIKLSRMRRINRLETFVEQQKVWPMSDYWEKVSNL